MFKRQISASINEGYNNSKSALLINGDKQIGKTNNYSKVFKEKNYIEINLIENKLALETFNTSKDS